MVTQTQKKINFIVTIKRCYISQELCFICYIILSLPFYGERSTFKLNKEPHLRCFNLILETKDINKPKSNI